MTDTLMRTWKFRAFAPREGVEAFEQAIALKRAMWAELCAMQEAHAAAMAPLLAVPKADRDAAAMLALRKARTARIADIRRAYAASGLAWGDYNAVVFQFDGAARASAARKALPRPSDQALGEAVVRQIMNGARPHQLLSRNDVWLEYLAPAGAERTRRPGSHRAGYRTARLSFLVRTGRNSLGEALLSLDMVVHRPLPPEASIVEVRVIRTGRPVIRADGAAARSARWHVTLVMKLPRPARAIGGPVGVALDWKGDGAGGANLAAIADARGVRVVVYGEEHIEKWSASKERFRAAEAEAHAGTRAALLAEAEIFRRRIHDERRTQLRTLARAIVRGAGALCLEKTWLAGKGVKKFTGPAQFRQELLRAAENEGLAVELVEVEKGPSKIRAAALRKAAEVRLFSQAEPPFAEAAE